MRRRAGPRLRDLDAEAHLDDPALRQRYVTAVFDLIAPRYDAFTRRFSFGMDASWKREVVRLAVDAANASGRATSIIADLACGTGDLASALVGSGRQIIGLDASIEMLDRAAARGRTTRARAPALVAGDMIALPLRDASVDVVTVGYGLRNASHLRATLDEVTRILRPGGHLVALDFFKPANALWRQLFLGYLGLAGSVYGWVWHREPSAYGYIPRSIRRFVTANELTAELAARCFDVYHVAPKLFGGICVHAAKAQPLPPEASRPALAER
jgi:demethylmenaquinone methyltransferase / 2-methoxy-6-polyprenyl-1,4-benzoquinol methylase